MLDLYSEFERLIAAMADRQIEYALCGGLAIAVYAQPRATVDIDLLVTDAMLPAMRLLLKDLGYEIEAGPMEFGGGATVIHRFTKVDVDGDFLSVDLLLKTPANAPAWEQIQRLQWNGQPLNVVSKDGLIFLKMMRDSEQDRADIAALRERTGER